MAARKLKRYGLEKVAKVLIAIGVLFNLIAWIVAAYYFGLAGSSFNLFIIPFIFTCVWVLAHFGNQVQIHHV